MDFIQASPQKGVICNYGITDHFKTGHLSVDLMMPLTVENASGMSLLAGVLSRGCTAYPEMNEISRFLAKNYGASFSIQASKAGELEILSLALTFLDNEYAIDGEDIRGAMIGFIKEMLFRPLLREGAFVPEFVEQEKSNLRDKITGLFNDKRLYSLEKCKSLMCKDEAFGISETGDLERVMAFDAASLYRFFCRLTEEAQVVLTYIGKDHGRFLDELADGFSPRKGEMPQTEVTAGSGKLQEIVDPMDLNQSKLNLGFRLGETALKDGAACRLFNVLYGGSATSKLFMNVRERLSLCYYCSSGMDRFKNVMFVSSGVEAEKYEEARQEIEAQLKAVAEGDFTEEELENARVYLIDSLRGFLDSQGALASLMISGTLRGELKTPEEEIKEISAVTREAIIKVAREIRLDTVYFLKGVHSEA